MYVQLAVLLAIHFLVQPTQSRRPSYLGGGGEYSIIGCVSSQPWRLRNVRRKPTTSSGPPSPAAAGVASISPCCSNRPSSALPRPSSLLWPSLRGLHT